MEEDQKVQAETKDELYRAKAEAEELSLSTQELEHRLHLTQEIVVNVALIRLVDLEEIGRRVANGDGAQAPG